MRQIEISSQEELCRVAEAILEELKGRTVVLLHATMGGGKTTLVRALAQVLGSTDNVTSPTFAIVNEYRTSIDKPLYHFDMYRIERLDEAIDLGFSDYMESGELCLVEWPERVEELLPEDAMLVRIEVLSDSARRFIIE